MSVQLPALRPQAAASRCSSQPRVSLPALPDSAPGHQQQQQQQYHHHQQQQQQQQQTLCDDASVLPLPDHFPEPYTEDHGGQHPHPHQHNHHHDTSPASPLTMVQRLAKEAMRNYHTQHDYAHGKHSHDHDHHDDNDDDDADARREGLRRITDKYAAPSMLHVNGSVCSSDNYSPPSVSPLDTRPASSTPSSSSFSATTTTTHHSPSPTPSSPLSGGGFSGSPVMNGRRCAGDPDATPRSCVQTLAGQQQNDRAAGPLYNNNHHSNSRLAALSVSSAFSDASSDMSDASPSPALTVSGRGSGSVGGVGLGSGRYQSVSGIALSTSLGEGVTGEDVQQVEMFYRSHKAEVTACRCLANLYFGSSATHPTATQSPLTTPGSGVTPERLSPASTGGEQRWEFVTTGIPLLVLDSGDHHRTRQLSLVVAEKGTGFVLWKDVVSHLTAYACPAANFHTLRISSDGGNKLAGLSFDDGKAAAEFASVLLKLTSDPDDELLMLSQKGKKKKKMKKSTQQQDSGDKRKKSVKFRPPKKSDISQPCCFQHVTKLERPQVAEMTPLPPNGFPPAPGSGAGSVSSLTEMLHDRLTVSGGSSSGRARTASSELSDISVEQ